MRDVRKFGKVILLLPGERHPRLELLGEDALAVSGDLLFKATRKRKATVKALTSLIEPILITFMGVIVGGVVLSVFLPILDVIGQLGGNG